MPDHSLPERRRSQRSQKILSIQYRLQKDCDGDDHKWHFSTTQDMSLVGISFLSDIPFQIDDVLEYQVIMSGIVDVFKGKGRVVRVEKQKDKTFLIAVEFLDHPKE